MRINIFKCLAKLIHKIFCWSILTSTDYNTFYVCLPWGVNHNYVYGGGGEASSGRADRQKNVALRAKTGPRSARYTYRFISRPSLSKILNTPLPWWVSATSNPGSTPPLYGVRAAEFLCNLEYQLLSHTILCAINIYYT